MNAYVESMARLSEARASELRREADDERLARSLRAVRGARRRAAAGGRHLPATLPPVADVASRPVILATRAAVVAADETPLRRTA